MRPAAACELYKTMLENRPDFFIHSGDHIYADCRSGVMTVTLKDVDNRDLWSVDIEPQPDARPGRVLAHHI
jgi:alkaline phosphatase D